MSISHYYNFVRYKIETVLSGETVEKFCFRNGIPYNFFRNGIEIRVTKSLPVISTCRMQGKSVSCFFRDFFREIVLGRRDYENLLAMMLEINN